MRYFFDYSFYTACGIFRTKNSDGIDIGSSSFVALLQVLNLFSFYWILDQFVKNLLPAEIVPTIVGALYFVLAVFNYVRFFRTRDHSYKDIEIRLQSFSADKQRQILLTQRLYFVLTAVLVLVLIIVRTVEVRS